MVSSGPNAARKLRTVVDPEGTLIYSMRSPLLHLSRDMTRLKQLRLPTLAVLLAAGTLQCGENPNQPPTASAIEMAGGNGQTGIVGQPLASPLVVLVTDQNGDPAEGVSVAWDPQGVGSVSSENVETGSDGRAFVTRVLGPDPGEQATTASVSGLEGSPVTFLATAIDGGGESGIVITTNPPVSALTEEVFDPVVQPVVQVTDQDGNPAAGLEVTASVASGSGTLEGTTTATTDAAGVARFGDLGISGTGSHTLEFTTGGVSVTSSPVEISALAPEASSGKWGPVVSWDIVPLHMNLMPNGKILAWGKTDARGHHGHAAPLGSGRRPAQRAPDDCGRYHALLCRPCPDAGRAPAGLRRSPQDGRGIATTFFLDQNGAATRGPNMAHGRWYPTVTAIARRPNAHHGGRRWRGKHGHDTGATGTAASGSSSPVQERGHPLLSPETSSPQTA